MNELAILIVDDEQMICNSGNAALKLLKERRFDAVITDIRMPFMTGTTLIRLARKAGFSGKIFVLSGYDDFTCVRDAFTSGADDYLLKPVSVAELDRKLRSFLAAEETAGPPADGPASEGTPRDAIPYALEYIRTHYTDSNLRMEEVAHHVSLSYSHFSSLFRRETGTTFPAYLRKLRIEKAIEYLSDPGMKISEVCYRVVFKYPQQLSNDFKRVTGVYPSEYFNEHGK